MGRQLRNGTTKQQKIKEAVMQLEVGASLSKKELIKTMYTRYDFYTSRSFDVLFTIVKKSITDRKYRTIRGDVTRIS